MSASWKGVLKAPESEPAVVPTLRQRQRKCERKSVRERGKIRERKSERMRRRKRIKESVIEGMTERGGGGESHRERKSERK